MSSVNIEAALKSGNLNFAPVKIEFAQSMNILGHKTLDQAMTAITSAQNLEFSNNVQGLAFGAEQSENVDGKVGISTQCLAEVAQVLAPSGTVMQNDLNETAILTQTTLQLSKEGLENYQKLMGQISEMWKTGTLESTSLAIESVGKPSINLTAGYGSPVMNKTPEGKIEYQFTQIPQ